ncbi:MAG: plasmid pRiA4b ORF-3 family protein [Ruminococcus sp.]|nr:plasmid pRiA4b ORF-3 family protein [Ruminococcus sp.]
MRIYMMQDNLKELEKEVLVICEDFTAFCNYVIGNKAKLSKKTGNIGKKDCFVLNGLFHVQEKYDKPVYIQNQYPIINFFYYIALKYKILELNSAGTILQQGRNYLHYCNASVWEQYALFLVNILFDGTFANNERIWYSDNRAEMWQIYMESFMEGMSKQNLCAGVKYQCSGNSGAPYFYHLEYITPYLEELNLIKIWEKPKEEDKCKSYWVIEPLPLLKKIVKLYMNMNMNMNVYQDADLDTAMKHAYKACIIGFVQGKKEGNLLDTFEKTEVHDRKQTIDLQVSIRNTDCIRVIRMNMDDSLYDLHEMIQTAVDFDDDHLFEFTVGHGMMKKIYMPPAVMNSNQDLSVETSLRELELRHGQTFTYLFDFGDMWQFTIKVLEIREGTVKKPEVIRAVGDAPEQYPYYEDDEEWDEEWRAEISEQIQVGSILALIDDELIREEHAVLMGLKEVCQKKPTDALRSEMLKVLLEKPDEMLMFITPEMRKMLSELLQEGWIDSSEKCTLAKLYSFGFCTFPDTNTYVVFVPGAVKEVYASRIKAGGKYDRLAEAAKTYIRWYGVVEIEVLYTAVTAHLKCKISIEDFTFLIYSRLHYFGRYYSVCFDDVEYMSCYDSEITQRILEERRKLENVGFEYPDFDQIASEKKEGVQNLLGEWKEYINFNLNIGWQTATELIEQIPLMAASGVITKDEIITAYKERLQGTGSRATKKAEGLIAELCSVMPLAIQKGNNGLDIYVMEKKEEKEAEGQRNIKGENETKEGYEQISLFDLDTFADFK